MRRRVLILVYLVCVLAPGVFGQQVLDSLMRVLPGLHGAQRVKMLGDIAWELGMTDAGKALPFGEEALKLAVHLGDSVLVSQAANDLAGIEHRLGHFQLAIAYNMRALRDRQRRQDTLGIAASHSKLGAAWIELMGFDSGLVHNEAAERVYHDLGDRLHEGMLRGNRGALYRHLGDTAMAIKATREAMELLEGSGNDYANANVLAQMAVVLMDGRREEEAVPFIRRALERYSAMDMKSDMASMAGALGAVAQRRDELDSAYHWYSKAQQWAEEAPDINGQATYLANLGDVLDAKGRSAEAIALYERVLAICKQEGYTQQRIAALSSFVGILERAGDTKRALVHQKELSALKDSVFQHDRIAALSEMQVKYETERTEKELGREREHSLAQQASIAQQRLWIGLIVGSALVLALLAWSFITRQRARLKAEGDAAVINERELGLKALVESTDAERTRIASELHDGVGQLLTGLKYRVEAAAAAHPELKEVMVLAADASGEVRDIAHRMMPRALGDLGLIPALTDMLDRSLKLPGMHHVFEHYGLDQRLPPSVEVGVYRIAQELVNNILKHARAQNVQVQLLGNKGHLVLIVEDDGAGIDRSSAYQGLGMRSMMDRARVLHGTLDLAPGAHRGTVATLRVPINNADRS